MKRKLPLLRGIAILTVILSHACLRAAEAFEGNVKGDVPFDTWSLFQYRFFLVTIQLGSYAVPAFLFISGLFVAYAVRGSSLGNDWTAIRGRLVALAWPFFLWSAIAVCVDVVLGIASPIRYVWSCLITGEVEWGYYFVPLLVQCYLLSIFIVPWMARRPGWVMSTAAAVQIASVGLRELGGLWLGWETIPGLGSNCGQYLFTRWIFYFVLGIWASSRTTQIAKWLQSRRLTVGLLALVFGALATTQGIALSETQHNMEWAMTQQRLFITVYALCALAYYFSLNISSASRLGRAIEKAGVVSLALYLIHPIFYKGLFRILLHFTPALVGRYAWVSALIYFLVGLGVIGLVTRLARQSQFGPFARRFLGL
jgi:peptidoglycan/LPS O-acetylase OafA/YrhL